MSGENIALGYEDATSVMEGWMSSEGHKRNILTSEYTTMVIGYYYDKKTQMLYWTQIFIK